MVGLLAVPMHGALAEFATSRVDDRGSATSIDALVRTLTQGSVSLTDKTGKTLGEHRRGRAKPVALVVSDVARRLRSSQLTPDQIAKLWAFFANEDNAALLALPIIESLVVAGNTPKGRAALWSELAYLTRTVRSSRSRRAKSLLGLFERHGARLRPVLALGRDTEIGGDEMVDVMLGSRIFGTSFSARLKWVVSHHPAPIARRIEFDRGRARPVSWEAAAFREILRWKDARFLPNGTNRPRTVAELDAVGETYTVIFNNLHELRTSYRERMLQGLRAADAYNVVIGGEFELYRMGTSSYREYLHPLIMRGIKEHGSFEAFVAHSVPAGLRVKDRDASGRRSMVFLRVVSTFALLEEVLETVRDRARFVDRSLASLGDPEMFRRNGSIIVDLLTAPSSSAVVSEFKALLITRLYERYRAEQNATLRNVYGSMLSVYQTVTGDRRDVTIDRSYPLDDAMFHIAFDRLFSRDGKQSLIHRMFMRMDEDNDAVTTYAGFHAMMRARGARVQYKGHHVIFRFRSGNRAIEIYVNKPTSLGITRGITEIAAALRGRRVETAIGRGHTFIIVPFLRDARRILGEQAKDAAVVMIGSCGGEASMRDIVDTFGYTSILSTRSTGRQVINNAIIYAYVKSLLALQPGQRLFLKAVLKKAVQQFARPGARNDLRKDARFYRLGMSAVLTAYLFDTHVRRYAEAKVR